MELAWLSALRIPGQFGLDKRDSMKTLKIYTGLVLLALLAAPATFGQTYSINVVGYYNLTLYPGDNLIANQLGTPDNRLNNLLIYGVADGSTLTKWDPLANQFLPASVFDAATTNWSINYSLTYGEGALLHSPGTTVNTFVGEVFPGYNIDTFVLNWNPNNANGLYLISSPVPMARPISQMFAAVTGRSPRDGEWVRLLDPATQTYLTTVFDPFSGTWSNGDPVLGVGMAAWFNLVPEPSMTALLAVGAAAMVWRRRVR
jgi:hypothetical protein